MEVTVDAAKDESDIHKHGVSLRRTKDFDFGSAFYDVDDSQNCGEIRYNAIGWLGTLLHTLTFTQDKEAIRAMSLRKATRKEQLT